MANSIYICSADVEKKIAFLSKNLHKALYGQKTSLWDTETTLLGKKHPLLGVKIALFGANKIVS
jgi:hypothetical protein